MTHLVEVTCQRLTARREPVKPVERDSSSVTGGAMLDHSVVGVAGEPTARAWTSTDTILYALGVGAGAEDPLGELAFTTENSQDVAQQVLPTFAVLAAQARGAQRRRYGDFDPAKLVHAEQGFE